MTIGLVHTPNHFTQPNPDNAKLIHMTASAMTLQHGSAAITLGNGDVQIQAQGRVLLDTADPPPPPLAPWAG